MLNRIMDLGLPWQDFDWVYDFFRAPLSEGRTKTVDGSKSIIEKDDKST